MGRRGTGGLCALPHPILPSRQGAALEICLMKEIKRVTAETIFQMRINLSQGSPARLIPEEPDSSPPARSHTHAGTRIHTHTHDLCRNTDLYQITDFHKCGCSHTDTQRQNVRPLKYDTGGYTLCRHTHTEV